MEKYPPGPICRTIHKTAESARKCMAHIPGPNFIGYKPELMADDWHPVQSPPQPKTSRSKGKGKRTAATMLKPSWRTNYPSSSAWKEGTPATSIPSLVKKLAKTTKRPRSASQSSSSSGDNYPAMREALNQPPMGPPLSKARKAKAHFYRIKAGEGPSDVVQYHPSPSSSTEEEHSSVVEAEVSPPKETQRFPIKFLGFKPLVTRQELDEGLQHYNETLRSAAFKLHMLIKSGRYNKDQALQLEQSFLKAYILHKIQVTPMSLRTGPRQPTLQDIYLALQADSPVLRRRLSSCINCPAGEADEGQPEVKPQGNLWEQPEATPNQPAYPTVHLPEDYPDEDVPALVGCTMEDFAPEEKFNIDNLDAPIKSESDSSVEEQITEAMAE